jgi:hypothetical protein
MLLVGNLEQSIVLPSMRGSQVPQDVSSYLAIDSNNPVGKFDYYSALSIPPPPPPQPPVKQIIFT